MGGEVADPMGARFAEPRRIDVRGVFASYAEAFAVWRGAAQESVAIAFVACMVVSSNSQRPELDGGGLPKG
jgi:hypothetical protein